MNLLVIAPVAVTLLGAASCLVMWQRVLANQIIAVVTAIALLVASIVLLLDVSANGIAATHVSGWPAPVGIVLVADLFSAIMVLMAGIIGLVVVVYSLTTTDDEHTRAGYYPLVLVLLTGVCGAFLTGDFFNLYVWFEVMLMASFVLLAIGGSRLEMEAALKYVTLNILASMIFLTTLGLLYSHSGTLNFADLAVSLRESPNQGFVTTVAIIFLVAFGTKAALFPLFFWLPASYHTPPVAVSALFAGLLTKVGVYALIRVYTLIFVGDVDYTHTIIIVVSGFTMVIGVLGAVAQYDFRRLLSFHIISQIGYMTMGLGLFTTLGLAGAIFYIAHNIIAKTNLFLISGIVYHLRGTFDLRALGGMNRNTMLSVMFIISAASLAGIPPLSGFFAKLSLVQAGFETGDYIILGVALAVGFLTLFSMAKIWNECFAKTEPEPATEAMGPMPLLQITPVVVMAGLAVAMGIAAGPLLDLCMRAAEQLLDTSEYITVVLGEGSVE